MLRGNDAGAWTRPSPRQYPHQWNWDSAFISLGWATFDWPRACLELEAMLAAQWWEGMVPHVHYDPRHLAAYFPGPDRWPRAQRHVRNAGQLTSGITNPPVLVTAAWLVGLGQADQTLRHAFWRRVRPALIQYLAYFGSARRLPDQLLPVMVHPWESGWDNSPRWDALRRSGLKPRQPYERLDRSSVNASERPTDSDYDAYLALVEKLEDADFDVQLYRADSPFCVHDVLLDAAWYGAAGDLNRICRSLSEPPAVAAERLTAFAAAFEATHWDEPAQLYFDWDCIRHHRIRTPTAAGIAALAGGVAEPQRGQAAWRRYKELCRGTLAVCTVPPGEPSFEAERYWRGPVWLQVNWLAARGLEQIALVAEARALVEESLALVQEHGLVECFDPWDGSPLGARGFSWSAALTLAWLER